MLLSRAEITLQIHILTFSFVLTACTNTCSIKSAQILVPSNLHPTSHTEHPLLPFRCVAFEFLFLDMGILRQHILSLTETRALCISITFSTQIHIIVCMSSTQHQVPFFRCILFWKQGLLITSHLDAYCGLYCQKNGFCSGHVMLIVILLTL